MSEQEPEMQYSKLAPKPDGPWTVEVDVYLRSDSNPPEFDIHSALECNNDDRLVFNNRGRPGFTVIFNLHDLTGRGYRFPDNEREAVWSQLGSDCPKTAVAEVLKPKRVINDGMSLVVKNKNVDEVVGEFTYTLRVTNGREWRDLDPGGLNQNGHTTYR